MINVHTIRATSTKFPLNTTDKTFDVEGLAPCSAASYTANRLAIPTQHTYNIGLDGAKAFPFKFDILPSSCEGNY